MRRVTRRFRCVDRHDEFGASDLTAFEGVEQVGGCHRRVVGRSEFGDELAAETANHRIVDGVRHIGRWPWPALRGDERNRRLDRADPDAVEHCGKTRLVANGVLRERSLAGLAGALGRSRWISSAAGTIASGRKVILIQSRR